MKKYGMILAACFLSVLVFLAAGMLPVVFISPIQPDTPSEPPNNPEEFNTPAPIEVDTDDRFGLWSLWKTGSNAASHTTYRYVPESAYASVMACSAKLEELMSAFIFDRADYFEYEYSEDEYLRLRDDRGRGMDVWHFYMQWRGDWRNWVDAYFDAKTGDLLYLYISTACEQNAKKYEYDGRSIMRSDEAAKLLERLIELPLISIEFSGALAAPAYAVYGEDARMLHATVTCNDNTYNLSDPGNYFDLLFIVTG